MTPARDLGAARRTSAIIKSLLGTKRQTCESRRARRGNTRLYFSRRARRRGDERSGRPMLRLFASCCGDDGERDDRIDKQQLNTAGAGSSAPASGASAARGASAKPGPAGVASRARATSDAFFRSVAQATGAPRLHKSRGSIMRGGTLEVTVEERFTPLAECSDEVSRPRRTCFLARSCGSRGPSLRANEPASACRCCSRRSSAVRS